MEKIFTVVIPMYNAEETIADTIKSVNDQTKANLISEIIVINDGSTDNSENVVEEISTNSKIQIKLVNKANEGVSKARNTAFSMVKTKWIALLDSDDIWTIDKIEKQNSFISKNTDIDFLGGNITDSKFKLYIKELPYLYKAKVSDICLRNFPQPSTAILKTKIYQEIGGFDEKQNYAEDQNYFLKICNDYNFYHVQERFVNYGFGKRAFGETGLSSNLKAMHLGNKKNMKEQYKLKNISLQYYIFLSIFNELKFIRRNIITALK